MSTSDSAEEPPTLGTEDGGTPSGRTRRQQTHSRRHRNSNMDHNPEILLRILEAANRLWLQIKSVSNFVMVELGGYQLFDYIAQWCVQHPQIALCLLAAGLVTFLPFLLLVGFGLSTILMTFTGFLVLEGTLLTILSMMLFGLLGALVIVLLFFAVVGVAAYFGFAHIYDLYGNVETHKSALKRFLQRENQTAPQESRNISRMENSRHEDVAN